MNKVKDELSTLYETFLQNRNEVELFKCIELKKRYLKARDRSLPTEKRINYFLDSLIIATAYEERLTRMKMTSKTLKSKVNNIYESKKNQIAKETKGFFSKRKGDQDKIIAIKTEKVTHFMNEIKDFIEIVDDALEYVRSASFTMKSAIKVLREYMED